MKFRDIQIRAPWKKDGKAVWVGTNFENLVRGNVFRFTDALDRPLQAESDAKPCDPDGNYEIMANPLVFLEYDEHTKRAAAIFGIKPEDVTPEQRKAGKSLNFGEMYGKFPPQGFKEAQEKLETDFAETEKRVMASGEIGYWVDHQELNAVTHLQAGDRIKVPGVDMGILISETGHYQVHYEVTRVR